MFLVEIHIRASYQIWHKSRFPMCVIDPFPYAIAAGCQLGADLTARAPEIISCDQTRSLASWEIGMAPKYAEQQKNGGDAAWK